MNALDSFKKIWKNMPANLEAIRKGINARTVICGDGISGRETPNGITISLTTKTKEATTDSMGGGAWVTVDVVDEDCTRTTIQVWAKPI